MVGYIHHQPVRILLDSGCGRSIITEKMAKKLNLPIIGSKKVNINSPIASQTLHSDRSTEGSIQSHDGSFQMNVAFNVVQDLKGLVLNTLSTDQFNKIQDLGFPLNNERPISNYPIEIIIGIEYYNSIWTGVPIQIESQLWIQQSKFGWIVSGINISEQSNSEINLGFIKTEDEVKQDEFKFIEKSSKVEDEFLDKYIDKYIKYDDKNIKYVASFPWIQPTNLKSNYSQALTRFKRLSESLKKRNIFDHFRKNESKPVVEMIKDRFYVDDLLYTHEMMSDVMLDEFKNDVIELFLTAGMNVRKWRCNQSELDKKWAPDEPPIIKVLGYKWNNAFGAVAYVISENKRNLLMSRVKLARKTSIPELELDAIHMAAELAKTLTNIINFKNVMIVSDSLINLNRLKKHPNCMESGLSLRIMKIRKLGCYIYQHTTTDKNAADLLSRGCSAKELADNNNRSGEL
ncbi:hypothetical protein BLOT_009950 [Blomia tropicalis]|nr:hypothetical protein BLOT_009950 [Blomia tropicalis]